MMINLFIFILLAGVYSYIIKLERTACACAEHENREFIKQFTIFALFFIAIITFIPMNFIIMHFGTTVASILAFIKFVFYIIYIIYLFMLLNYTRYLINEKCKCSEDIRRELIMTGTIIEIVIILIILLTMILLPILFNSITIIVENIDGLEKEISVAITNPYKSLKNIPKNIKKSSSYIGKIGSETKKGLKSVFNRNKKSK